MSNRIASILAALLWSSAALGQTIGPVPGGSGGSGTVTSVSVATANGVSGSVANPTTTPAITLTLGAIVPTTVNGNTITTGTGTLTLGSVTLNAGAGGTLGALSFITPAAGVATFLATPSSANFGAALTDKTGTGVNVFATSPTLTTPNIGVATATSINGNTFTTGTYTLTGTAGKTLTFQNTITLAGTDAQTYTFPTTSATIARTDAAQSFTGLQTFGAGIASTGSVTITAGNVVSGAANNISWSGRGILTSPAAAQIQHGAADAASPVAQMINFQSVVAGNANTAGANATIQGSLSNGSGGGDILIKTTLSNAASGTQNTAATALTLKGGDQSIIMASTTDATSTSTGAVQIAGGVSITKRVFVAGLTASAGLQTAVLCLSSSNEIIADSVACLASSERFKQDIAPSDLGLAAVMAMRPIVYRYAPTGNERFDTAPNQRDVHAGFRAEDVAKIDRRLVAFDGDGVVRTVRQDGILASMVKAIQEQQAQIDALKMENNRRLQ